MKIIEHPDIPFQIKDAAIVRNGAKEPASPEAILLALCYQKLAEIAENTKPHKLEIREEQKEAKLPARGKKEQGDSTQSLV